MQVTLQVQGMSCNHCKHAVTTALSSLEGVSSVNVDLATGKVDITYDETLVTLEQMKEAVEDQGYEVVD